MIVAQAGPRETDAREVGEQLQGLVDAGVEGLCLHGIPFGDIESDARDIDFSPFR